jgi:hypothetical protein
MLFSYSLCRDSSVGIEMDYVLNGRGYIPGRGNGLFSSPQCPDRLWGPSSHPPNGFQELFPRGWSSRGMKLTTPLHQVPRSRKVELYIYSCLRLAVAYGGKGRPARKSDNLTVNCEPVFYKMWEPRRLTTLWASTACYEDSFTFLVALCDRHLTHNWKWISSTKWTEKVDSFE